MPRQRPRRPTKSVRLRTRPTSQPGQVQLWVRSPRRRSRWLSPVLTAVGLWLGLGLLLVALSWGLRLILNPQALPQLQALFQVQPQPQQTVTLAELETAAAQAQERLGEPLVFPDSSRQVSYWLLPVYALTGDNLVAVRVYRPLENASVQQLQLLDQLEVAPLPETEVLGPLLGTPQAPTLGQRPLPLTQVAAMGRPGWFTLEGRWRRSGTNLRYGQIIYFDDRSHSLKALLPWSSPQARGPQWVDLDGTGPADLLIDESTGLDPVFHGVQVLKQGGLGFVIRLQPVSFTTVPVDSQEKAYRQALALAQAGLWSKATQQLQQVKQQISFWPAVAEAQLRLIERHAARSRQQAEQTWSSATQKILTQLIDGRWQAALSTLQASPESLQPLQRILAQDEGRIWNRISAALRLNPQDQEAMVWGGLILQAQQDTAAALAWFDQRQGQATVKQQFQAVMALAHKPALPQPSRPQPETAAAATATTAAAAAGRPVVASGPIEAVIGTVTAQTTVTDRGFWPQSSPPQLGANQTWYAVNLLGQMQGGYWYGQTQTPLERLWRQLTPESQSLQLLPRSDLNTSIPLQVQGIDRGPTALTLLATGPRPAGPLTAVALAYSPGSLIWLNPQAGLPAADQPALRQGLQAVLSAASSAVKTDRIVAAIDQGSYYPINLTSEQEQVLMLDAAAVDILVRAGVECDRTTPKTVIVSADGTPTYHNLFTPETLVAVTDPQMAPARLLVWTPAGYQLRSYN